MAPKPVRWAYAARADLLEALEHIVEESPQAAWDFFGNHPRSAGVVDVRPRWRRSPRDRR